MTVTWPAWAEADNDRLWEYWKAGLSEAEAKRADYAAEATDTLDSDVVAVLSGDPIWAGTYVEAKVRLALEFYDTKKMLMATLPGWLTRWLFKGGKG
jgi:hypothetical protein